MWSTAASAPPTTGRAVELTVNLHGLVPHVVGSYAELPEYARELEVAGVSQLALGDMLLLEPDLDHAGAFSFDPATGFLEPLAALAAIAGATSTVRLTTGILVAPIRHPALLAKTAATVDLMSGGRLDLVLAAGWSEALFAAFGVPHEERFARLDECVAVCRTLWASSPAEFSGRWTQFGPMHGGPAPLAGAATPLWLGALVSSVSARRVARSFEGWAFNSRTSPEQISLAKGMLATECDRIGRDASTIALRATAITAGRHGSADDQPLDRCVDEVIAAAERCHEIGVNQLTIMLNTLVRDCAEAAHLIAAVLDRLP